MSQVNYNSMSQSELKEYFLKHRGDRSALQAYLDRLNQKPPQIIAYFSDVNFDTKVAEVIRKKLNQSEHD